MMYNIDATQPSGQQPGKERKELVYLQEDKMSSKIAMEFDSEIGKHQRQRVSDKFLHFSFCKNKTKTKPRGKEVLEWNWYIPGIILDLALVLAL